MIFISHALRFQNVPRKYHCPRCKTEEIIEYDDSFDCPICRLEFEKRDCDLYEDDQILSVEEKLEIVSTLINNNED